MEFVDVLEELKAAADELRQQHEHLGQQVQYRDELIRKARAQGKSWTAIQDAAGVGPRIISIAIKRGTKK